MFAQVTMICNSSIKLLSRFVNNSLLSRDISHCTCSLERKLDLLLARSTLVASPQSVRRFIYDKRVSPQTSLLLRFARNKRMYSSKAQCAVGMAVKDIETPALLLCLEKFEHNLQLMSLIMKGKYPKVALRPHAKSHKCPAIARKQIELGAIGICCQTVSEVEAMVAGGIKDIFLCNQVVGARKLQRLVNLAKEVKLSLCVDNEQNIEDLNKTAGEFGVTLELVIEVNVGGKRCGVDTAEEVLKLAQQIQSLPFVNFKGLHCYNGILQHTRKDEDRKKGVEMVVEKAKNAISALKDGGIDCNYVTGGGTGTFKYEAQSGIFTEVQPGSYIFMDADYNKNLGEDGSYVSQFKQSLFVLSTVQSVASDRAVVDAGMKALSLDSGPPLLLGSENVYTYHGGSDEHGPITPRGNLQFGDQIWLIPGHCDPTVNMHDWIIGLRDGRVESLWQITGRGPGV